MYFINSKKKTDRESTIPFSIFSQDEQDVLKLNDENCHVQSIQYQPTEYFLDRLKNFIVNYFGENTLHYLAENDIKNLEIQNKDTNLALENSCRPNDIFIDEGNDLKSCSSMKSKERSNFSKNKNSLNKSLTKKVYKASDTSLNSLNRCNTMGEIKSKSSLTITYKSESNSVSNDSKSVTSLKSDYKSFLNSETKEKNNVNSVLRCSETTVENSQSNLNSIFSGSDKVSNTSYSDLISNSSNENDDELCINNSLSENSDDVLYEQNAPIKSRKKFSNIKNTSQMKDLNKRLIAVSKKPKKVVFRKNVSSTDIESINNIPKSHSSNLRSHSLNFTSSLMGSQVNFDEEEDVDLSSDNGNEIPVPDGAFGIKSKHPPKVKNSNGSVSSSKDTKSSKSSKRHWFKKDKFAPANNVVSHEDVRSSETSLASAKSIKSMKKYLEDDHEFVQSLPHIFMPSSKTEDEDLGPKKEVLKRRMNFVMTKPLNEDGTSIHNARSSAGTFFPPTTDSPHNQFTTPPKVTVFDLKVSRTVIESCNGKTVPGQFNKSSPDDERRSIPASYKINSKSPSNKVAEKLGFKTNYDGKILLEKPSPDSERRSLPASYYNNANYSLDELAEQQSLGEVVSSKLRKTSTSNGNKRNSLDAPEEKIRLSRLEPPEGDIITQELLHNSLVSLIDIIDEFTGRRASTAQVDQNDNDDVLVRVVRRSRAENEELNNSFENDRKSSIKKNSVPKKISHVNEELQPPSYNRESTKKESILNNMKKSKVSKEEPFEDKNDRKHFSLSKTKKEKSFLREESSEFSFGESEESQTNVEISVDSYSEQNILVKVSSSTFKQTRKRKSSSKSDDENLISSGKIVKNTSAESAVIKRRKIDKTINSSERPPWNSSTNIKSVSQLSNSSFAVKKPDRITKKLEKKAQKMNKNTKPNLLTVPEKGANLVETKNNYLKKKPPHVPKSNTKKDDVVENQQKPNPQNKVPQKFNTISDKDAEKKKMKNKEKAKSEKVKETSSQHSLKIKVATNNRKPQKSLERKNRKKEFKANVQNKAKQRTENFTVDIEVFAEEYKGTEKKLKKVATSPVPKPTFITQDPKFNQVSTSTSDTEPQFKTHKTQTNRRGIDVTNFYHPYQRLALRKESPDFVGLIDQIRADLRRSLKFIRQQKNPSDQIRMFKELILKYIPTENEIPTQTSDTDAIALLSLEKGLSTTVVSPMNNPKKFPDESIRAMTKILESFQKSNPKDNKMLSSLHPVLTSRGLELMPVEDGTSNVKPKRPVPFEGSYDIMTKKYEPVLMSSPIKFQKKHHTYRVDPYEVKFNFLPNREERVLSSYKPGRRRLKPSSSSFREFFRENHRRAAIVLQNKTSLS